MMHVRDRRLTVTRAWSFFSLFQPPCFGFYRWFRTFPYGLGLRLEFAGFERHRRFNCQGRLWLGGKDSILLSEGCWFNPTCLHAEVPLGNTLNPKLLPMCWSAPSMAATALSVWTRVWITVSHFGQKRLRNAPNVNSPKCSAEFRTAEVSFTPSVHRCIKKTQ